MMRYLKILLVGLVVIGLFTGPATAAILSNSAGNPFGTGSSTGESYRIAYEIYSESAGVSTVASRGVITIALTQPLFIGETANLVIAPPVNADFNSAGANYKWALRRVSDLVLIGITPSAGLITANLPFSIVAAAIAGDSLAVIQWDDANDNNLIDGTKAVVLGAGIYVRPGLSATCDSNPIIKIDFTTPHETTPQAANFAYITAQFSGTGPASDTLTAELNTDFDFKQFILGSGAYVTSTTTILNSNIISVINNGTGAMWIAYADVSPEGNITFNVNSVIGELATSMSLDGTTCVPNAAKTVFTCTKTAVTLPAAHSLSLLVNGTTSNEPTNWSLSDFAVTVTTAGLKNLCVALQPLSIGVWHGGLEAFVPFVKGGGGYETYIILYNRYFNDAKIFVSTFKDSGSNPIMISTSQIIGKEVIPAGGKLVITDTDILDFLTANGYSWNPADGIPVKFSIRVPSQTGITSTSGIITSGTPYTYSGTQIHQNPRDPFVEGIVVSTFPTGQRSIPLKFKTFKNGEYSH